jgi:hypothetical protein
MGQPIIFDPSDNGWITFHWDEWIPSGVSLVSVTHSVPLPMTITAETTDVLSQQSAVRISGAQHGGRYMVTAQAVMSNGETLNRQYPIVGWDS